MPFELNIFFSVELFFYLFLTFFCFCRADELETALMEMVKQDNRRQLSAKVYSTFLLFTEKTFNYGNIQNLDRMVLLSSYLIQAHNSHAYA
jgi:hypothetical protein